jgi:hypothetical protein
MGQFSVTHCIPNNVTDGHPGGTSQKYTFVVRSDIRFSPTSQARLLIGEDVPSSAKPTYL